MVPAAVIGQHFVFAGDVQEVRGVSRKSAEQKHRRAKKSVLIGRTRRWNRHAVPRTAFATRSAICAAFAAGTPSSTSNALTLASPKSCAIAELPVSCLRTSSIAFSVSSVASFITFVPAGAGVLEGALAGTLHGLGVPLGDSLLPWSPSGYGAARSRPARGPALAITPPSLVELLRAGWDPLVPLLHPSAAA